MSATVKASTLPAAGPERPATAPSPFDPFAHLPDNLMADMRELLIPCQEAGLQMEVDPRIPMCVGVGVHGMLFRVAVVSDRQGEPQRVEILGPPNLSPWSKADFLNLIPEARGDAPPPLRLSPMPPPRPHATDVLLEILAELKMLNARLP